MSHKSNAAKQENFQPPASAPALAKPSGPTGWRKWCYRLLAMTLMPAFFLLLLEILLRLCGYGYPAGYFLRTEIDGQQVLVDNPYFGHRFFPPHLPRYPVPTLLAATKPAGTYRIFILGESAALGFPDPSYQFGRILHAMLRDRYPDAHFEIVNTSVAAINSHGILPISRDCAENEPDLFIAYMGNNEVWGPYGTTADYGAYFSSLQLIRASVWIKATRTGQLITDLLRLGYTPPPPESFIKTAFIGSVPAHDRRLPAIYSHFERNLHDICHAARQADAKVILCTVASNLKDSPPFTSVAGPDLTAEQAAAWKEIYEDGIRREAAGDHVEAVACYRRAAVIDDKFAELHFRLARCLGALKKHAEAHRHYVLARDLDAMRARTDSRLNGTIRALAGDGANEGVYLADVERSFNDASGDGTAGAEFFYEHVHLTFAGQYWIARTVFEQLVRILPDRMRPRGGAGAPCLSLQECQERLPFTEWSRFNGLHDVITWSRDAAPFTSQLGHADRMDRALKRLLDMKARLNAGGAAAAVAAYRRVLEHDAGDFALHKDFAMLLKEQGQLAEAAHHASEALKRLPNDPVFQTRYAEILALEGKLDDALAACEVSLKLMPANAEAHNIMGRILLQAREPAKAAASFARALKLYPPSADFHANLGKALAMQKQYDRALAEYEEALRIDPGFINAHHQLGLVFNNLGRPDLAVAHLQEAVRIDAKQPQIHADLATVLMNQGNIDQAIAHLEEALRLRPDWPEVTQTLHQMRMRAKQLR